jgi:hypothetical protein
MSFKFQIGEKVVISCSKKVVLIINRIDSKTNAGDVFYSLENHPPMYEHELLLVETIPGFFRWMK